MIYEIMCSLCGGNTLLLLEFHLFRRGRIISLSFEIRELSYGVVAKASSCWLAMRQVSFCIFFCIDFGREVSSSLSELGTSVKLREARRMGETEMTNRMKDECFTHTCIMYYCTVSWCNYDQSIRAMKTHVHSHLTNDGESMQAYFP